MPSVVTTDPAAGHDADRDPWIEAYLAHVRVERRLAARTVELYAYRFPAEPFEPFGEPETYAHVSTRTVRPLGPPEPVGDLLALHEAAGIGLRVLPQLCAFWAAVAASTLGFSGIRLGNARP